MNGVFLSWTDYHGRSTELADALSVTPVYVASTSTRSWSAPLRYAAAAWRTARSLQRARPPVVICMLPPFPAAVVCYLYCALTGSQLVLDMHTGVFHDRKWSPFLRSTTWIARRATLSIVHNEPLAEELRTRGVRCLALDDPPGSQAGKTESSVPGRVVLPLGYANDEPIDEILRLPALLPELELVFTGRAPRAFAEAVQDQPNVHLPGYLSIEDYSALVASSAVVVALTTRPLTMQRAGYEALARHVPLVTSSSAVLRTYFGDAAVYSDNDALSVARAIREAVARNEELRRAMRHLHEVKVREFDEGLGALVAALR